jgi:hypothetical protein
MFSMFEALVRRIENGGARMELLVLIVRQKKF